MNNTDRNAAFKTRNPLMTRDNFRAGVFQRDNDTCVICGATDVPLFAHHILERRLWDDGGYYLANGSTVCEPCHIKCEKTDISVEDVRVAAGIRDIVVPDYMYQDQVYDKWGNPYLGNGVTGIGPLFYDESVQKILAHHIENGNFRQYVKYPRTMHLPWSESVNDDDRMMKDTSVFDGKRVIVTEKQDGENTYVYNDYIHARSIDGRHHVTRNWVKSFVAQWQHDIPAGYRVCGENMYAVHSIRYDNLPSYFLGFSMWDTKNDCLGWDETMDYFALLGVTPVPVLYDCIYDEAAIKKLWNPKNWEKSEGYVIRLADPFPYQDFRKCVAKFVRVNHIATTKHWMHRPMFNESDVNGIAKNEE